jgi:tetratricopeptide (TPR) repeat protein
MTVLTADETAISVAEANGLADVVEVEGDGEGDKLVRCHSLVDMATELRRKKLLADSEHVLRRALHCLPDHLEAQIGLAHVLYRRERLPEADLMVEMAVLTNDGRTALPLRDNLLLATVDLAEQLRRADRSALADALIEKVIALEPENARMHRQFSMLLLRCGEFKHGWREYDDRTGPFSQPVWRGEPLAGKTILVQAMHGFGDTIQFMRLLPLLKAQGARVILEHRPALAALLQGVEGWDVLVARHTGREALELDFDLHIPLMRLPHPLGIEHRIPATVPYLRPDPARVLAWRERLHADSAVCCSSADARTAAKPVLRVGLVWAGSPEFKGDQYRSCRLSDYAWLARVPGVQFYSLQKGKAAEQAQSSVARKMGLIDLEPHLHDWADTAAAIMNLDLVIAVDTAVCHLAGALGKPVFTLLPSHCCWRWLEEREDSPWYPTMRLFRQTLKGDWTGAIQKLIRALHSFSQTAGASPVATVLPASTIGSPQAGDIGASHAGIIGAPQAESSMPQAESGTAVATIAPRPTVPGANPTAAATADNAKLAHCSALIETATELRRKRLLEESANVFQQALNCLPGHLEAQAGLAMTLYGQNRFAEADRVVESAIRGGDGAITVPLSGGLLLAAMALIERLRRAGRSAQADALIEKVMAMEPENTRLHHQFGMLLLQCGDFKYGWQERGKHVGVFPQPVWRGEALAGKTILVQSLEGFGDTFQFVRLLPLLKAQGARVILEHHLALTTVLQGVEGWDVQVARRTGQEAWKLDFDYHIPIMSLPHPLGIEGRIPATVPYLRPDPTRVLALRKRMVSLSAAGETAAIAAGPAVRVGLVWAGNPRFAGDRFRSCLLADYARLAGAPGVQFYSLQKGKAAAQMQSPAVRKMGLIDLEPHLHDWADTAAAIMNLDLVITVDSAVCHLAGALGKPVFTVLPRYCCWRWLEEREDTPWYPNMRLFRQSSQGDWSDVIHNLSKALRRFAST